MLEISKSAVQFHDRLSVLPEGDSRTEFPKAREIFLE
jgi:hypothetical protein